jgi:hypothetical protein
MSIRSDPADSKLAVGPASSGWIVAQRNRHAGRRLGRQCLSRRDAGSGRHRLSGLGVFGDQPTEPQAAATLDYLLSHSPESIPSAYLLALTINAIAAIAPNESRLNAYVARLEAMKQASQDGKHVWWEQTAGRAHDVLRRGPGRRHRDDRAGGHGLAQDRISIRPRCGPH